MRKICIVSGSRADYGLLEWPTKVLREDGTFQIDTLKIWGEEFDAAFASVDDYLKLAKPDLLLILGDRYEILAAATAAHLQRIPIAHIAGGDITEGSYDDAMRDGISRMATIHFVTSTSAMARLSSIGYRNIHLVGNPAIDYIRHADWKKERLIAEPYVVVSYQAETIDGTVDRDWWTSIPDKTTVYIRPNPDNGGTQINGIIESRLYGPHRAYDFLPHAEFLNLIFHCDEFIGNSSSMLYEAPELGIKTRMIGKRQRGRTIPWGDGNASKRILTILKYTL